MEQNYGHGCDTARLCGHGSTALFPSEAKVPLADHFPGPIVSILYLRKGKLDKTSRLSNAGLLRSAHSVVTSADEGLTSGVHGK